MSKRDFGNIKSLLHFDFPYVNEPNEGLDDDAGVESWSREGNTSISTTSPVFGYRCANFPDTDSYIIGTNAKGTFNLSPSGSYELEAYVKVSEAPEETVPVIETSTGDYRYYGGHTFKLIEEYVTWAEAKAACEEMGGHLATSTSAGKNEFLCGFMEGWTNDYAIWLGVSDEGEDGTLRWITGEELSYTNWGDGNPTNTDEVEDCAELFPDGSWGSWNNTGEGVDRYVCEWDEELGGGNSSGTLKLGVNAELKLTVEAPDWGINEMGSRPLELDEWEHVLLRIRDGSVKLYQAGTETMSATISGSQTIRKPELRLGGYVGSMDEFVFRKAAGSEPPEEPEKPYSASTDVQSGGGYGNGHEGLLTVSSSVQINSYGVIESVTDSKTFTVANWSEGLYPARKGREVMLHVMSKKGGEEAELGKYGFGRILRVDGNDVVLKRELEGEVELTEELIENYYVQVIVMPNFRSLTVESGGSIVPAKVNLSTKRGGGIVAFRVRRHCKVEGSILTHGYGCVRNDLHQMTNSKMLDRFLCSQGGGIFITCGGRFMAGDNARLGATWSGKSNAVSGGVSYSTGNGAAGYGGGGGSIYNLSRSYGGIGGGGGGGVMSDITYKVTGGNGDGSKGKTTSNNAMGSGGGGCGGAGGSGQTTETNKNYRGTGGSGGGGQGGSGGAGGKGYNRDGMAGGINGGDSAYWAYKSTRYYGGAGGGAPGGNGGTGYYGKSSATTLSGGIAGASILLLCKVLDVSSAAISTGGEAGTSNNTSDGAYGGGAGGGGTGFCYIACKRQVSDE